MSPQRENSDVERREHNFVGQREYYCDIVRRERSLFCSMR